MHDTGPGSAISARKEAVDGPEGIEDRQRAGEPPQDEASDGGAQRGDEQVARGRKAIDEPSHGYAPDAGGDVDAQQGGGGGHGVGAEDGLGVRGEVDGREEVARRLDHVGDLEEDVRPGGQEVEVSQQGTEVHARGMDAGRRNAGADPPRNGEGEDEDDGGPDAQGVPETEVAQEGFHEQGEDGARDSRAGPEEAECQTPATDEPLFHVQEAGDVGDGAADGVQDPLGGD